MSRPGLPPRRPDFAQEAQLRAAARRQALRDRAFGWAIVAGLLIAPPLLNLAGDVLAAVLARR